MKIGFIGLGNMGQGMADNLLNKGAIKSVNTGCIMIRNIEIIIQA